MSALARYFHTKGFKVAGYDKTITPLIKDLMAEGIAIHTSDMGEKVESIVGTPKDTLVVVTPAVPKSLKELKVLEAKGFTLRKRAQVLGEISKDFKTLGVAGTHGKTTTSTLLAHVLSHSAEKCNAFLGGVSSDFNSNLVINENSPWMVVEADEFDRSFHQLTPFSSIITSVDADHLDIYEDTSKFKDAFQDYANLIHSEGSIVLHHSVQLDAKAKIITYGVGDELVVDYQGVKLRVEDSRFVMDIKTPYGDFSNIVLGLPGVHNAENALAVIALCDTIGLSVEEVKMSIGNFKGVKRRFEYILSQKKITYIDDYAHHPTAIKGLITSVRLLHPESPIYLIFQPHLYSRTQDFMDEFAEALGTADYVYLLPIYPARELPIKGVTSEALSTLIPSNAKFGNAKMMFEWLEKVQNGVVLTVGAGDISQYVNPIKSMLSS
ncbi:UDP-N-acetylmuramate--L-alanine ligase [Brumimicrobium salinarum]|uniref:UDP-N-acetylmuramate--L-alanine ligase n=2 Tax=Brumimicrobium salinarum TaxID=2058658 RepID=A0A2I0QZR4_9FLAO|nr:UDP-N-acetylmuramate--L-alanine ligase [Brumimicrobium salinarum]